MRLPLIRNIFTKGIVILLSSVRVYVTSPWQITVSEVNSAIGIGFTTTSTLSEAGHPTLLVTVTPILLAANIPCAAQSALSVTLIEYITH